MAAMLVPGGTLAVAVTVVFAPVVVAAAAAVVEVPVVNETVNLPMRFHVVVAVVSLDRSCHNAMPVMSVVLVVDDVVDDDAVGVDVIRRTVDEFPCGVEDAFGFRPEMDMDA